MRDALFLTSLLFHLRSGLISVMADIVFLQTAIETLNNTLSD